MGLKSLPFWKPDNSVQYRSAYQLAAKEPAAKITRSASGRLGVVYKIELNKPLPVESELFLNKKTKDYYRELEIKDKNIRFFDSNYFPEEGKDFNLLIEVYDKKEQLSFLACGYYFEDNETVVEEKWYQLECE